VTYYELFGVAPTASLDEIHRAYRRAVRRYHPDVNRAPNAAQITARLNEAWATLADRARRADYDRRLLVPRFRTNAPDRAAGTRAGAPPPAFWARPSASSDAWYQGSVVTAPSFALWLAGRFVSLALAMVLIATFIALLVHSLPLIATVCAVLLVARVFGGPRRSRGWGRSCGRS
jgi:curved DNA-binding protein CbpA